MFACKIVNMRLEKKKKKKKKDKIAFNLKKSGKFINKQCIKRKGIKFLFRERVRGKMAPQNKCIITVSRKSKVSSRLELTLATGAISAAI